jgi:hypothetical protein
MKNVRSFVLGLTIAGSLVAAALPARAAEADAKPDAKALVKVELHVTNPYLAQAQSHADAMAATAQAKTLDCASGSYTADGADVDGASVDATSDGKGGCNLVAKLAKFHEFDAAFQVSDGSKALFTFVMRSAMSAGAGKSEMVYKPQ